MSTVVAFYARLYTHTPLIELFARTRSHWTRRNVSGAPVDFLIVDLLAGDFHLVHVERPGVPDEDSGQVRALADERIPAFLHHFGHHGHAERHAVVLFKDEQVSVCGRDEIPVVALVRAVKRVGFHPEAYGERTLVRNGCWV